jgi:hypothetical protein
MLRQAQHEEFLTLSLSKGEVAQRRFAKIKAAGASMLRQPEFALKGG